ncbi:MAG: hypothetical protein VCE91_10035 [Nitrospinota bacterium]
MTPTARDWGITLLRLWMGFSIALVGYEMAQGVSTPASLTDIKSASLETWVSWTLTIIFTFGGAAIFLGIAFLLAALLTAVASAYFLWDHVGTQLWDILNFRLQAGFLVVSAVLILTGPGRLSLGPMRRKRK